MTKSINVYSYGSQVGIVTIPGEFLVTSINIRGSLVIYELTGPLNSPNRQVINAVDIEVVPINKKKSQTTVVKGFGGSKD